MRHVAAATPLIDALHKEAAPVTPFCENKTLQRELQAGATVYDDELGVKHRLDIVNRERDDKPRILFMAGLGNTPRTFAGQQLINELAQRVDGQLVFMPTFGFGGVNLPSNRRWNFEDHAASCVRALEKSEVGHIDVAAGVCLGGVVSARMARQLDVDTLFTAMMPGVGVSIKERLIAEGYKRAPAKVLQAAAGFLAASGELGTSKTWADRLLRGNEMAQPHRGRAVVATMQRILNEKIDPSELFQDTMRWVAFMGGKDEFSDPEAVQRAIYCRDTRAKGMSLLAVLDGAKHNGAFSNVGMANMLNTVLELHETG